MTKIKSGDRCQDCKNCQIWNSDRNKAKCDLNKRPQGFYPDSGVPSECVDKMTRRF